MENLGVYIRKSRESNNQKSLKEQILLGTEFAKDNGFNPILYNDGIVSGAGATDKRPQYEKMLSDIANGKLYGIYIWNTDRTARDEIAWHTLANLLKENKVFLFDNGNKADFSNENTLLFYTIKSGMDAYFSRVTSSKIKAVLKRNANEGKFSGILKYGYSRDKNGMTIINEVEAKVVNEIFDLCISGLGYTAIANHLNENNVPTRYNKIGGDFKVDKNKHGNKAFLTNKSKSECKWSNKVIGDILRSENYIGKKKFKDSILKVPKIISLVKFNKAQIRIDKRKNKHGKQSFKPYLLNNILLCANCGKRYTGRTISNYDYYRCASGIKSGGSCGSNGIRLKELDKLIWNYFIDDAYYLNTILNNPKQDKELVSAKVLNEDLNKLNNSLKAKNKEINNVTKYLIQDIIKQDEAEIQLNRIRKNITDLELKVEQKKETLLNLTNKETEILDFQAEAKNLHINSSFEQKKEIIERYIEEISIINMDAYFTIDLRFKKFNNVERFIIDKDYKDVSLVDIEHDNETKKQGYLNAVDFGLKEFGF